MCVGVHVRVSVSVCVCWEEGVFRATQGGVDEGV